MKDKRPESLLLSIADGALPGDIPAGPGVYIFHSQEKRPLYVGKSKKLRQRLLSYFRQPAALPAKTRIMVQKASYLEVVLTRTEKEALILEAEFIARYKPRYNIRLRDDKAYPFIRLGLKSRFPRLSIVRKRKRDGALYFGPYTSSHALRQALRIIFNVFRLRSCSDAAMKKRSRPCLKYQIERCSAPCTGEISCQEYMEEVSRARAFLEGRAGFVVSQLEQEMKTAAGRLEFEKAALYRDQLQALKRVLEAQAVVLDSYSNLDVVHIELDGENAHAAVLKIREGTLGTKHSMGLHVSLEKDIEGVYADFLKIYYSSSMVPPEIVIPVKLAENPGVQALLEHFRNGRVRIKHAVRGKRKNLLDMARINALQGLRESRQREAGWRELSSLLKKRLGLRNRPNTTEGIDISNISGSLPVGSLVSFDRGEPNKSGYRHYFLKSPGPDDYAMIREVVERRIQRGLRDKDLPDLLLIDGGPGQLGVAQKVLEEYGIVDQVDLVSIAKERQEKGERIFIPGLSKALTLDPGDRVLLFCQRVRDEAHRFGVKTHRARRSRKMFESELLAIPGIGPSRQLLLLKHFGSIDKIACAQVEELEKVPGLPSRVCTEIVNYFREQEKIGKD